NDTGEGMTEEKAQAIRYAFEKRDALFVDRYGGLGIGLAISKELLDLMGGNLTLRSAEGVGSTFRISLKLPKGRGAVAHAHPLGLQRVLLVTDSVSERAKLLDYFQEWQLDVDSLGSGPNLLEKMRQTSLGQQPFDLAVIDLQQQ